MNIYQKLAMVQKELKAPKNQYNSFGKYNYRNCEDILEAAKPLCLNNKLILTLRDQIVNVGDRYYIQSTATITDSEDAAIIEVSAYARESLEKKGMDESQITGAASSYARKYALNGLFCIDDTKDADSGEHKDKQENKSQNPTSNTKITTKELEEIAKSKHVPVKQLIDRYVKETNKKCSDLNFIPQEYKQKYYDELKMLVVK